MVSTPTTTQTSHSDSFSFSFWIYSLFAFFCVMNSKKIIMTQTKKYTTQNMFTFTFSNNSNNNNRWLFAFIGTCVLYVMSMCILLLIVSYFVLKWLKSSIEENNILFYQLNKKSEQVLKKHGHCKLNKVYLVRQPFSKVITFGLNVLTMYQYNTLIQQSRENFPYHTMIVFELIDKREKEEKEEKEKEEKEKGEKGEKEEKEETNKEKEKEKENNDNHTRTKWLLLEKNHCINVSETFMVNSEQERMELCLSKEVMEYSLNDVLQQTQTRMGNHAFFNWQLYNNNCQEFTKEVLVTLNQYTQCTHEFIFRNKLMSLIIPSDFTLHVGNCLCVVNNMIEKYVFDCV